jgi:hypothetical protein
MARARAPAAAHRKPHDHRHIVVRTSLLPLDCYFLYDHLVVSDCVLYPPAVAGHVESFVRRASAYSSCRMAFVPPNKPMALQAICTYSQQAVIKFPLWAPWLYRG